jgi:hypothetical protein
MHIFNIKVNYGSIIDTLDVEVKPRSIVVLWMVSTYPNIELKIG